MSGPWSWTNRRGNDVRELVQLITSERRAVKREVRMQDSSLACPRAGIHAQAQVVRLYRRRQAHVLQQRARGGSASRISKLGPTLHGQLEQAHHLCWLWRAILAELDLVHNQRSHVAGNLAGGESLASPSSLRGSNRSIYFAWREGRARFVLALGPHGLLESYDRLQTNKKKAAAAVLRSASSAVALQARDWGSPPPLDATRAMVLSSPRLLCGL